ncbi:MAG TPA: PIN domain-containing protein, partial [Candidatus Nanoarchaeia archaeon]|nr:PIN domain-containing protein [Candidatus Nanoarchaeia archaeon]
MIETFLDTNILVYAFDLAEAEKQPIAYKILQQATQGREKFHISNQVLAELSRTLTHKLAKPYTQEETIEILTLFQLPTWIIYSYRLSTLTQALRLQQQNTISFWDALIVATMMENHVYQIYTEDM